MPLFAPFRALRYAPDADLDAVTAPPYDVLLEDDVQGLKDRDPHNIVHIDIPGGGGDRYANAAHRLGLWTKTGVLAQDEVPSFTIYRMGFTDATGIARTITGVLGGLEVVDEGAGGVLPHERTTPKAKTDRLDLTRATAANLSPVWGLSLAQGLTKALAAPGEPVGQMHAEGVLHSVERVSDPARITQIQRILAADDVLIADGHHRYAISRTYRDEIRKATGSKATDAEYTLTFVNELIGEQLSIEAIHRLCTGIGFDDLKTALAKSFNIFAAPIPTPEALREMESAGRLILLAPDGKAFWLEPKSGAFVGVRALDGAYLEHALAGVDVQISYQHGLEEMKQLVSSGQVSAGILIRPTSIGEIERTAREGLLMPPKSTFFTPKLRTGLVIRPTAPLPSHPSL
ncbi:MAG: DUF1015 domain-containing protein [Propionibacteriaceae bacterium]|jgi:uncharacterized protein (DUF1015 family)|nr:DUF1015 domain-containing protein [Propionibacteriaceae bacterium]